MPDFFAAAQRHLDDGDFMHGNKRDTSAVQLWAYGGECVLKAIGLKQNFFALDAKGKPTKGFGMHLNQNPSGQTLISLYNAAQTGTAALIAPAVAFVGWDVNARYEDGSQLIAGMSSYQTDAQAFRGLLLAAIKQGMLP